MKDIYTKIIGIVLAVLIVLTAFNFIRDNDINEVIEKVRESKYSVRILSDVSTGTNPLTINFEPLVLNNKGNVEYLWDFGDGNTSKEKDPAHLYIDGGEYLCKLTVRDEEGNTVEDRLNISINKNKPPIVVISLNKNTHERKFIPILSTLPLWPGDVQKIVNALEKRDENIFGEGSIICEAQVDDPENDEIVSYEWVHQAETQLSQFGKPEQPTHNFSGNNTIKLPEIYTWPMGRHVISLTVVDSVGNKANASIEFQVEQSLKKIQRNQMKNAVKGLLNQWLLVFRPFFGAAIAAGLLSLWRYDNFEGIKLITLLLLTFILQLDMSDALLTQSIEYLDSHPFVANILDKILIFGGRILKGADIDMIREMLGLTNKRPEISEPFPENNAKNIPVNCPYVAANVNDFENDTFNVSIYGDYVINATYNNQTNNTFIANLSNPLPEREDIYWYVEVVDQNDKIVRKEYKFTTFVDV